ncbi:unnamed protein product [Lampetra fluviatilis]
MPTQATSLPLHHNVTAAATVLPKNGTGQGHGSPNERTPGRSQRADAENELRFVTAASSSCLTLSGAAFQERPAPRLYAWSGEGRARRCPAKGRARPSRLTAQEAALISRDNRCRFQGSRCKRPPSASGTPNGADHPQRPLEEADLRTRRAPARDQGAPSAANRGDRRCEGRAGFTGGTATDRGCALGPGVNTDGDDDDNDPG